MPSRSVPDGRAFVYRQPSLGITFFAISIGVNQLRSGSRRAYLFLKL
jgi:hypothetical protein